MKLTFGSLFAGAGGMCLGFERAGLRKRWHVEIDGFCQGILRNHWPDCGEWDDIKTFSPDSAWSIDILCGGDPCQANSAAGKSTQQSLGGEFLRVVDALRPRIVVRENPSLVRKDAPWPWWKFRSGLESLGYAVLPFRLRACCLGAEHRRDRLFLLATIPDADGDGLEGWARQKPRMETVESSRLVEAYDWPAIPSSRGFDSRAGIPGYVDSVRALGNCVCPQVAEWVGRRIVEAEARNGEGPIQY